MSKLRAAITAVGHYLPDSKLTNQDLEKIVNTTDEWITTRPGLKNAGLVITASLLHFLL